MSEVSTDKIDTVKIEASETQEQPKKQRGRPRKNPPKEGDPDQPKKQRGRPRKNPPKETDPDQPKKPRGRPKSDKPREEYMRDAMFRCYHKDVDHARMLRRRAYYKKLGRCDPRVSDEKTT